MHIAHHNFSLLMDRFAIGIRSGSQVHILRIKRSSTKRYRVGKAASTFASLRTRVCEKTKLSKIVE